MPQPPVGQPVVRLVIDFNPVTSSIQVSGPIDQPMVAYGMLELARAIIDRRAAERDRQQKSGIVLPQIQIDGGLKA